MRPPCVVLKDSFKKQPSVWVFLVGRTAPSLSDHSMLCQQSFIVGSAFSTLLEAVLENPLKHLYLPSEQSKLSSYRVQSNPLIYGKVSWLLY